MLEFQHLRGFQGLNYSLKFAESLTLDKLKTWYYGTIGERERERKKRERERNGFPFPLNPYPFTKERELREKKERERESTRNWGKCAVCADSAAGRPNRGRTLCKCLFII